MNRKGYIDWVALIPFSVGILRDDLEKFIDAEITKLEEELEKL